MRNILTEVEQPTKLNAQLQERGVGLLTIVGVATDWCVRASALDALAAGYAVEVVAEATAGVNLQPDDSATAIAEIVAAGGVIH